MYKILVADSVPKHILAKYDNVEGVSIEDEAGISAEDLKNVIGKYDGLVVRSRTKVTADIIEAGKNLKVIGRAGAGVDNIDVPAATSQKIVVMNTPGGNTIAAAEHTIAMLLAALRNIPRANQAMLQDRWDKKANVGNEIYEKTVGVIGLGKIGYEVAKRLAAFDAILLVYDPLISADKAAEVGAELVDLKTLLEKSDIITVHAPKMPETMNMLNKGNLKLCKDGVVIINCARGGIVNENDLLEALDSGKVFKAAIDVFTSEPLEDYTIAKHEKVTATPHLGASTQEAQIKVGDQILEQMIDYLTKNKIRNAVNEV